MKFRNPLHSQHVGRVWFSLFLMTPVLSQTAFSQDEGFCYQIHLDGRDRSVFQYVSRNFLVFSDPSWTTNPAVKSVRWVEAKAGNSLPPPPVLPANLRAGAENPWGGIKLPHLSPGKELRLELDGKPTVLKRVSASGSTCPRLDLLLDGRWGTTRSSSNGRTRSELTRWAAISRFLERKFCWRCLAWRTSALNFSSLRNQTSSSSSAITAPPSFRSTHNSDNERSGTGGSRRSILRSHRLSQAKNSGSQAIRWASESLSLFAEMERHYE